MTSSLLYLTNRSSRGARIMVTTGLLAGVAACSAVTVRSDAPPRRIGAHPDARRPVVASRPTPPTRDIHPDRREAAAGVGGQTVARAATRLLGTPYIWGGASPAGFDCSGLVKYVYARHGIELPRTVREQYQVGSPVPRDGLRAGDVVFFDRLRHNGVYIGHAHLVHASTLDGIVKVASLDDDWFRDRWVGARRLIRAVAGRDTDPRH
jgi:peptidoglycan DL-endopeptidase LytE